MTKKERMARAREARSKILQAHAEAVSFLVRPLVVSGNSYRQIATTLNTYRIKPPSGKGYWKHPQVARVVQRLGLA